MLTKEKLEKNSNVKQQQINSGTEDVLIIEKVIPQNETHAVPIQISEEQPQAIDVQKMDIESSLSIDNSQICSSQVSPIKELQPLPSELKTIARESSSFLFSAPIELCSTNPSASNGNGEAHVSEKPNQKQNETQMSANTTTPQEPDNTSSLPVKKRMGKQKMAERFWAESQAVLNSTSTSRFRQRSDRVIRENLFDLPSTLSPTVTNEPTKEKATQVTPKPRKETKAESQPQEATKKEKTKKAKVPKELLLPENDPELRPYILSELEIPVWFQWRKRNRIERLRAEYQQRQAAKATPPDVPTDGTMSSESTLVRDLPSPLVMEPSHAAEMGSSPPAILVGDPSPLSEPSPESLPKNPNTSLEKNLPPNETQTNTKPNSKPINSDPHEISYVAESNTISRLSLPPQSADKHISQNLINTEGRATKPPPTERQRPIMIDDFSRSETSSSLMLPTPNPNSLSTLPNLRAVAAATNIPKDNLVSYLNPNKPPTLQNQSSPAPSQDLRTYEPTLTHKTYFRGLSFPRPGMPSSFPYSAPYATQPQPQFSIPPYIKPYTLPDHSRTSGAFSSLLQTNPFPQPSQNVNPSFGNPPLHSAWPPPIFEPRKRERESISPEFDMETIAKRSRFAAISSMLFPSDPLPSQTQNHNHVGSARPSFEKEHISSGSPRSSLRQVEPIQALIVAGPDTPEEAVIPLGSKYAKENFLPVLSQLRDAELRLKKDLETRKQENEGLMKIRPW